jgi:hypothetical protein
MILYKHWIQQILWPNIESRMCHFKVPCLHVKYYVPIGNERKYILLKVCYVPATNTASSKAFLNVAINSNNKTNKAGSTCH